MSTCSSNKSIDFIPSGRLNPTENNEIVFNIHPGVKNYQIKSKYRSPNSTPAATPYRTQSRERTSRSKDISKENINNSCISNQSCKTDLLIEKYKQDISHQSYRMQELKKNMQQYDYSIQNLLQNKSQDSEKKKIYNELEKKNKDLKERLKYLEEHKEERVKQENQHLDLYLQEKKKLKSSLIQQISDLEEENNKVESTLSKYSKSELTVTNAYLKSTHSALSMELKKIQNTCITQEEFFQLQTQIRDLEEMQSKLVKENNALREDIIKEQKIELAGHENNAQQRALCREVAMIKKEISILNSLAKGICKGEQPDLSFILGSGHITELEGKNLSEAIGEINNELNVLKQFIVNKNQDNCKLF
jgi:DNA repair exonuclease SbcCD ATPase subunit